MLAEGWAQALSLRYPLTGGFPHRLESMGQALSRRDVMRRWLQPFCWSLWYEALSLRSLCRLEGSGGADVPTRNLPLSWGGRGSSSASGQGLPLSVEVCCGPFGRDVLPFSRTGS